MTPEQQAAKAEWEAYTKRILKALTGDVMDLIEQAELLRDNIIWVARDPSVDTVRAVGEDLQSLRDRVDTLIGDWKGALR